MLRKVILKNFQSHNHTEIDLPNGVKYVEVSGPNGSGKSSLFEGIRFGLYGDGRGSLKSLVRNRSESGMEVVLFLDSLHGTVEIHRGLTKKGSGFCKVIRDGSVIAEGGADPNSKAQPVIDDIMGMDRNTFGIRSFYGLGDNDHILRVTSSEKLDFLQKISGIDICQRIKDVADRRLRDTSEKRLRVSGAMDTLEKSRLDPDEIGKALIDLEDTLNELSTKSIEKERIRSGISDELKGYTETIAVIESRAKQLPSLNEQLMVAESKLSSVKRQYDEQLKLLDKSKKRVLELNATLKDFDEDILEKEITALVERSARLRFVADVRTSAMDQSGLAECPVCMSSLSSEKIELLRGSLTDIMAEMDDIDEILLPKQAKIKEYRNLVNNRSELLSEITRLESSLPALAVQIDEKSVKKVKIFDEINALNASLDAVRETKAKYDACTKAYSDVMMGCVSLSREIGLVQGRIEMTKSDIMKAKQDESDLKRLKKEFSDLQENARAYEAVSKGFSRTEIPLIILKDLRTKIEKYATDVISGFMDGRILIVDIEGGRPGIDFVFEDVEGSRSYSSLSKGEKALMFLSVRYALSKIIKKSDARPTFIAFDEVLDGLTSENVERVVGMIHKVYGSLYDKVLFISHIPVPAIFDMSIQCTKENGISSVKVVV